MEKSAQEPESKSASDQSRLNVQRTRRERHITGQLCPCSAVKNIKQSAEKQTMGGKSTEEGGSQIRLSSDF